MYGVQDPMFTTDTMRKVTIHEVTIEGQDRVLRSIVTPCNIGGTFFDCGKIVDDSLMSTWFNGDYSVVNFRSGGRARVVYTRDGYQAPQAPPVPNFSSNGRWMTVRRRLPSDESWSIEVMHPDGSAHRSVPVHFQVAQGGLNPWISDDGTELIVASGGCVRMPKYFCRDSLTFYRVGVETGKATLVASFPSKTNPFLNAMISNDGRSLAILDDIETRVDFYELDFSQLLKIAER
jgi:hypothetical protein